MEGIVFPHLRRVFFFFVVVFASSYLLTACDSPQCIQGSTQICTCADPIHGLLKGVQVCNEDEQSWSTCQCYIPHDEKNEEKHKVEEKNNLSDEAFYRDGGERQERLPEKKCPCESSSQEAPFSSEKKAEKAPDKHLRPIDRIKVDFWPWGAEGVVSLSIDDGLPTPFIKLMPEIESRGWRATFFVATSLATANKSWPLIKKAYLNGHEIGSHTHNHVDLTKLTEKQIHEELQRAIAELQKHIDWKMPIECIAYPYEQSNPLVEKILWQYHRYGRGGDQGVPVPPNPVPLNDGRHPNWKFLTAKAPTHHYSVKQWNTWVDAAVKQRKWLIEEYHGVDGKDWEPRTLDEFRAHFDHIERYGRRIWVAPVSIVGHFIDERQTLKIKILIWTPDEIVLQFKDNFGEKHNTPLTFTLNIPPSWQWKAIKVTQNKKILRTQTLAPSFFRTEGLPDPLLPIRIIPQ